MSNIWLFLSGMFFANGIPHFVNGISGKITRHPFLYRWLGFIPNSLFNALWGLFSFFMALLFFSLWKRHHPGVALTVGFNRHFLLFAAGMLPTTLFLSLYFVGGGW